MKTLRLLLLCLLPVMMLSCTDTREELTIQKNGKGMLVVKTDMGKMLELLKGFGGKDMGSGELDKAFDTTMLMKDYIDTAKDATPEQKELFRDAKVHLALNMKENLGKLDMHFPFASLDQLQKVYANMNSSQGGIKNLFNGMNSKMSGAMPDQPSPTPEGNDNMPQISNVYDIVIKDGLYSRKVNKQRYDDFARGMKLEDMKQMGGMLGDLKMDYTLDLNFPRPVKRVSNPKAVQSADKKSVTLTTDLMEVFQHPELLAVEIEY
jgi:hypothetical protein